MKENFLCFECRNWFETHHGEIPTACHNAYQWSGENYRKGNLESALRGISAAYEMTEIMLNSDRLDKSYATDCLVATLEIFILVLNDMDRERECVDILQRAILVLTDLAGKTELTRVMPKLARMSSDNKKHLSVVH